MKHTLLQIGKTRESWLKEGVMDYQNRLSHYCGFNEITLPDLRNISGTTATGIKKREGELYLKKIRKEDYIILLDESGKIFTSEEFAAFIQKLMNSGRNIVWLIGGAYGFSEEVYARADEKISLSRLTFSHQMVRLIFAEQLYRGMTIIKGEPYHHA